eukprot:CAMPEP_0184310602 /NCGR_PEP_ID=MMETSP1049-20130417/31700_1 /TAXON_ID=77928 /ORGANISM="Proteomonas sulcata, Strain CCMP704" /LENGTH=90 /DNA_ID=CAMNT_0026624965 /DNA_START=8 /DNA_END=276 /DNA_ORIENTATION=-
MKSMLRGALFVAVAAPASSFLVAPTGVTSGVAPAVSRVLPSCRTSDRPMVALRQAEDGSEAPQTIPWDGRQPQSNEEYLQILTDAGMKLG